MEIGQGFVAPELTFRPKTLGQTSISCKWPANPPTTNNASNNNDFYW